MGELRDHPKNARVVALLKAKALPKKNGGDVSPWDIDDYELHTHPDLREKLREIASDALVECECAAYGYPVLTNNDGIIFAIARGTSDLAFRLPPDGILEVVKEGGVVKREYGDDWVTIDPWGKNNDNLKRWCLAAYRFSETLSQ